MNIENIRVGETLECTCVATAHGMREGLVIPGTRVIIEKRIKPALFRCRLAFEDDEHGPVWTHLWASQLAPLGHGRLAGQCPRMPMGWQKPIFVN
jgi:hypothetical protein